MHVEVGVDPSGDRRPIVVIVIIPFAWGGWHRTDGTMDRTATGLCGRLL